MRFDNGIPFFGGNFSASVLGIFSVFLFRAFEAGRKEEGRKGLTCVGVVAKRIQRGGDQQKTIKSLPVIVR